MTDVNGCPSFAPSFPYPPAPTSRPPVGPALFWRNPVQTEGWRVLSPGSFYRPLHWPFLPCSLPTLHPHPHSQHAQRGGGKAVTVLAALAEESW